MTNEPITNSAAMTILQFCKWANISRSSFYLEAAAGRIAANKVGKRVLIKREEAERWLAELPAAKLAQEAA